MSRVVLEKELKLIKRRLEAVEEALGEEMNEDEKAALAQALMEHRRGKTIPFKPARSRARTR